MKDNAGTVLVSQTVKRTNYLSHFTASSNAVTVEYLLKVVKRRCKEAPLIAAIKSPHVKLNRSLLVNSLEPRCRCQRA
jgi:hypothetical protein